MGCDVRFVLSQLGGDLVELSPLIVSRSHDAMAITKYQKEITPSRCSGLSFSPHLNISWILHGGGVDTVHRAARFLIYTLASGLQMSHDGTLTSYNFTGFRYLMRDVK